MEKTVCELFAGVGGFRLGLERASNEWNTVWANQWEPGKTNQYAFDCYCAHFGDSENHVNKNISEVDKKKIPAHNLLVGGFPCQDYSVARSLVNNNGIEGKKGVLWWDIYDTLKAKKPSFVLLENVDRLLKSPARQRGRDFGIILTCFNLLGYSVEWRVINAADYGFAQRRRRTFIFAYKNTTNYGKSHTKIPSQSIFNTDGFFAKAFPIETITENVIDSTKLVEKDLADVSDHFAFPFLNSGYMSKGSVYTCKSTPVYEKPVPLKKIVVKNAEEKYYLKDNYDKYKYLKGAKRIERTSKTGYTYNFTEGPIAFPDPLDKPARTMLTSEGTVNRSTHVIEDPKTKKLRILTPIETERIQGFDDDWTNTGMTERFRYFCMGNALVVGLITRMGKQLNIIFENE